MVAQQVGRRGGDARVVFGAARAEVDQGLLEHVGVMEEPGLELGGEAVIIEQGLGVGRTGLVFGHGCSCSHCVRGNLIVVNAGSHATSRQLYRAST
jgi:hypothetical protein